MAETKLFVRPVKGRQKALIGALVYAAVAIAWIAAANMFFPQESPNQTISPLRFLPEGLLIAGSAVLLYVLLASRQRLAAAETTRGFPRTEGKLSQLESELNAGGISPDASYPAMMQAEKHLQFATAVFDNSYNSIMITDAEANIVAVNPAFSNMTGYAASDVIGKNPRILHSERQNAGFYQGLWNSLLENGYWQGELWNRHKDGKEYLKWLSISAIRDQNGVVTHYVGISDDITQTWENINKINFLASFDELTGLTNRHMATNRLEKEIAHAQYLGTRLAFMVLDLDNFKNMNESLGHSAGDTMLKTVAQRLLDCVSGGGFVSRQGGDEFFIILPDVGELESVNDMAGEILNQVNKPFRVNGTEFFLSASIGIAIYPSDGSDADTLQKNAEMAMYSAKQAGRNTYRFFDEGMHAFMLEKLLIRNGLLHALDRGEFLLHYQPQICLESGRMTGAEALLRWRQTETGIVYPGSFIDIAEESGLIIPIGDWVLHEACRQAVAWHRAGWPGLKIAVNISALQFGRGDLDLIVANALTSSGLDPAFLELEVTESVLIHNTEKSLEAIQRLKRLGVKLSLDDFGTGFSSLNYLKRLPVDKLKIDRSFVRDIMTDKDDAAIVLSIISLAHTLQKKVIAEGVETREQIGFLRRHRCDEMQGYFFSHPLAADDFMRLLQKEARLETAEHV